MVLFCGTGTKWVKDVYINLLFPLQIPYWCVATIHFLPNFNFHRNLCYSIIPKFYVNCLSVLCFIYKLLVLLHHLKVIKEFKFLIYLSMPIDNLTWQVRVGIFNSSKPFFKIKVKHRVLLQLLLHHTINTLYLFLTLILITQVNNPYQVPVRLMKNIPASFGLRFLEIADITVFLLFFIQNLLFCCGDIE